MARCGGSGSEAAARAAIEHCEAVGRDESTIERSIDVGVPTIRDSRAEAFRVKDELFAAQQSKPWKNQPTGTPEDVFEWLTRYVELGYRHIVFYWPAPYDLETMERILGKVDKKMIVDDDLSRSALPLLPIGPNAVAAGAAGGK